MEFSMSSKLLTKLILVVSCFALVSFSFAEESATPAKKDIILYIVEFPGDCSGENLVSYDDKYFNGCQEECQNNPDCKGFSFKIAVKDAEQKGTCDLKMIAHCPSAERINNGMSYFSKIIIEPTEQAASATTAPTDIPATTAPTDTPATTAPTDTPATTAPTDDSAAVPTDATAPAPDIDPLQAVETVETPPIDAAPGASVSEPEESQNDEPTLSIEP